MAWTYNDWDEQTTNDLRLTRLRSHISEVTSEIGADVSADGKSRSSGSLTAYLDYLKSEKDRLLKLTGGVNGGVSVVKFKKPA